MLAMSIAAQKSNVPLKRLRDLQAMSRSANVHEADTARLRLRELLFRYRITEDDLVEEATEVVNLSPGLDGSQREELARITARSRGVKPFAGSKGVAFRGFPEAAKDARQLFTALLGIVEHNCEHNGLGVLSSTDAFLWRTCFWLGFIEAIQRQTDPEHGAVPKEALAARFSRSLPPPVIERAAQAFNLMSLRYSGLGVDRAYQRAEQFKQQAHDSGFNLGMQIPVPPYKGKR